jgi:3-phenylpropionate/trans-cinnamate dioxygenase ferredoxin subunit
MSLQDAGPAEAFREGIPTSVRVMERDLVVVRRGSEFFVLRDVCPHQGARLSTGGVSGVPGYALPGDACRYERDGEILTCPWHGWQYDLRTGASLLEPEQVRVRTYSARVMDGRVVVDLSRP